MPIPIYVPSLVDAAAPHAIINAEFVRSGLSFDFVDAINGQRMTDADLRIYYDRLLKDRNFTRPMSRGEIACALGHRNAFVHIMVKLDSRRGTGETIGRQAGVDLVLTRRLPVHTTGRLLGRQAVLAVATSAENLRYQ
ncbi:glycosyltransferase family 25 protein [Aquamicrobium segne]|uniref:Glycosyltransferase family 25 protein n=1 Tax=Aquamicrobium segne TaxID=469547 RepID=A0ABW0GVD8_9HYPH